MTKNAVPPVTVKVLDVEIYNTPPPPGKITPEGNVAVDMQPCLKRGRKLLCLETLLLLNILKSLRERKKIGLSRI